MDVLAHFDGRIAAELRLWDAIDQQFLAPFAYYGVHDGLDLSQVPWRRGRGYDVDALTAVMTADHVWARRVIERSSNTSGTLGRCARSASVPALRTHGSWPSGSVTPGSRQWPFPARRIPLSGEAALDGLRDGAVQAVFSVDIFNEGVDVRDVDTLLLLRPTDSPTLYIQQLGRGLRRPTARLCTVLDFVANHRREFRFDRRFRALVGGSRRDVERQVRLDFPFLPAGCHLELDPIAQDIVLRSLREALPSDWRSRRDELVALGDVDLRTYLEETGLELEDLYMSGRSWSALRRAAGLRTEAEGPREDSLLRAVGRLLHIDDVERLDAILISLRDERASRA